MASLLPISVSFVLLILAAVGQLPIEPLGHGSGELLRALGSPLMVLLAAMVLTLMPGRRRWRTVLGESSWLSTAIMGAAPLILITAAATGFSRVLQNSGLPDLAGEALGGMGMEAGLVLPFVIAAALRIAQGSVLVAMISAGGFCEPLLANLGLSDGSGRAFATLAIGAGAMVGSHANDSLFWVVSRTIGLSPAAGYRLQTLGTCCAGFAAALALVGLRAILG